MNKDGQILLVETDPHACGQLCTALNRLQVANEILCFSDIDKASQYLKEKYEDVFLVLQNVAAPGLQLPKSRNMVYMHEKFNVPEVAYMFLIHPNTADTPPKHTFIHCYYRLAALETMSNLFQNIVEYWNNYVFPPMGVQQRQGIR